MFITALVFIGLAAIVFVLARTLRFEKEARVPDEDRLGYSKTVKVRDLAINKIVGFISLGLAAVAALALVFGSVYTQDQGEANVLKDMTGNIVGQSNETGLHFKAPWVDTVTYNIRNQQIVFAARSDDQQSEPEGPQITVQDKEGVSSNIDVAVRYSIRPDAVTDIYKQYRTEENFKKSFIEQDIRAVVRLAPNQFSTIDLLTNRAGVEADILKALEKRWEQDGVLVDSLSLQEIRAPEAVRDSYASAQQAQINVTKEKANLEAATVKAQLKVATATAEAEANRLLDGSLTANVLESKRLDSLVSIGEKGNLIVVPEGSTPFVQVSK